MGKQKNRQPAPRIKLDESGVATYLFRLFRKQAVSQARAQEGPKIKNVNISPIRNGIEILHDYSREAKSEEHSEQTDKLAGIISKLKKKDVSQLEFLSAVKDAGLIATKLLSVEFCEFLLDSPKRRSQIVEILRTAAEWSAFIPGFSLEKLYGPYVRELSDEMDTYANRNYDVTFNSVVLLCVSITLVVTVAAPNKDIPGFIVSIPHSGFYFGVASFFLYVVLVFAWVFARNAYQQQKRAFLKDFLASIAEPIQNPERIDDEYLTHLLESFKIISGKKDKPATKKAHEKMRRLIRLAMDIRSGTFFQSKAAWIKACGELVASWGWPIILTLSYVILVFCTFSYIQKG